MITCIIIVSCSCVTNQRGSYYHFRGYGNTTYNMHNRNHYKARKNRQPIAKNYQIRNTRSSGKY